MGDGRSAAPITRYQIDGKTDELDENLIIFDPSLDEEVRKSTGPGPGDDPSMTRRFGDLIPLSQIGWPHFIDYQACRIPLQGVVPVNPSLRLACHCCVQFVVNLGVG